MRFTRKQIDALLWVFDKRRSKPHANTLRSLERQDYIGQEYGGWVLEEDGAMFIGGYLAGLRDAEEGVEQ